MNDFRRFKEMIVASSELERVLIEERLAVYISGASQERPESKSPEPVAAPDRRVQWLIHP